MSARFNRIVRSAVLLAMALAIGPAAALAAPLNQEAGVPEVGAHAAIVVEYPSGRILYEKAMHERMAPASLTKILTAILALEHGNLEEPATADPADLVGESSMGLVAGEQQSLHNLLYGLLLPSGNDAAMTIARHIGAQAAAGDSAQADPVLRFMDMMNARVAQLGLVDSHFVNPHGLDAPEHYSTAYDLASLTWYALHFPQFNEVVKMPFYEAPGHSLKNTNEMLSRYMGADGVKTGWTDACGLCLVTSASRDGKRLISVVLNAPHWYADSAALLDYGFGKLLAAPQDLDGETLSVTSRGTASWLLASTTPAPAIPIDVPPVGAQGGGAAPQLEEEPPAIAARSDAADEVVVTHAPLALRGTGSSIVASGSTGPDAALLGLALFAVVAVVVWWLVAKPLRGFSLANLAGAGPVASLRRRDHQASAVAQQSAPAKQPPAARTLGAPPANRRRQPNLLLTPEDVCEGRIARAVLLAAEGRQGSSMAEFLMAIRDGCDLQVADVSAQFDLTPEAYLALARAQMASGRQAAARETLEYAVAVAPGNRVVQLALYQISSR